MSKLTVNAHIYGKHGSVTKAQDTRAIMPLDALVALLDIAITFLLEPFVNSLRPSHQSFLIGAQSKTQPMDIAAGLHLVLEKGLDRKAQAVLAQADIKKYYDRLPILKVCLFLENHGVPLAILGGLLRLHFCIRIVVNFEGGAFVAHNREDKRCADR